MWYRSVTTGKMIHDSSSRVVNHIFGNETFEKLVAAGNLQAIEPPTVEDILKETNSVSLGIVRYHEMHGCSYKTARKEVNRMAREMTAKKGGSKEPAPENDISEEPEVGNELSSDGD